MNQEFSTSSPNESYLWFEFKRFFHNSYLLILIYALLGILFQWTNDNLVPIKCFPGGTMIDGIRQFAYGMLTLPFILVPLCYSRHMRGGNNLLFSPSPLKKTMSAFVNIILMIGLYVGVYTMLDYFIILFQPTHTVIWEEFASLSSRHFFQNISMSSLCIAYGALLGTMLSKSHKFMILFLYSISFGLISSYVYTLMCRLFASLFENSLFQYSQIIVLLLILSVLFIMIYYVNKNITVSNEVS